MLYFVVCIWFKRGISPPEEFLHLPLNFIPTFMLLSPVIIPFILIYVLYKTCVLGKIL